MAIFTVAYLFKKISQLLALGKPCKLGTIIQSDIYQNLGTEGLTPLSHNQKTPAPEEFSGAGVIFMPPLSIYQALVRD